MYLPPVKNSRLILADNCELLALACPRNLGHIGKWEKVEGDCDAPMDADADGEEPCKGGEEKVCAKQKLQKYVMGRGR